MGALALVVGQAAVTASRCQASQPWGCFGIAVLLLVTEVPAATVLLAVLLRRARTVCHPWATSVLTCATCVTIWRQWDSVGVGVLAALPPGIAVIVLMAGVTAGWAWLLERLG